MKKEMIPMTDEEISVVKSRKFVTYAKKNLVQAETIKMYLNYAIKQGIIIITLENLGSC